MMAALGVAACSRPAATRSSIAASTQRERGSAWRRRDQCEEGYPVFLFIGAGGHWCGVEEVEIVRGGFEFVAHACGEEGGRWWGSCGGGCEVSTLR